ncbi:germinal-center associated nuclear protein [Topomyia yanbarensis]|uniref:germinal-center associated nuclear protein n=1 Tax=Topomyia yanbarensis TaxID=2498891 RepID=UPI00273B0EE0|nr:germinal-center associated nuclear protein [Topomyia yanbarensis]
METFLRGSCDAMCPKSEIDLRTKEKLLHFYELRPDSKTEPDPFRMVKEFSRSAAGVKQPKHWEIRTAKALKKTVTYLLTKIFQDERRPYSFKYDFIFDRLRAVRQEVVMQNLSADNTLHTLAATTRFLAYSAYHLCEAPVNEFDPKICQSHLQECVKKVLRCYDDLDEQSSVYDDRGRIEMEGLYLMLNLGNTESINRGITLRIDLKKHLIHQLSMNIEYLRGNFYRVLIGVRKLPPLEAAIVAVKLPEIRRQLLLRFSIAFNSKVLTVPLEWIGHVLQYQENEAVALIDDCKYYGLQIVDQPKAPSSQSCVVETKDDWWDSEGELCVATEKQNNLEQKSVKFERSSFDGDKLATRPKRVEFVDQTLGEIVTISGTILRKLDKQ